MDPFLGQIVQFAGNFAPRSWAFCNGQLLSIAQNTALFSILGTTYGGDGRTTFALPDLRGRISMHPGTGPGLTTFVLGQKGGRENVSLLIANMPSHTHPIVLRCNSGAANSDTPVNGFPAVDEGATESYQTAANAEMGSPTVGNTGGSQGFDIRNPFLCVNHIIAIQGTFPSRN